MPPRFTTNTFSVHASLASRPWAGVISNSMRPEKSGAFVVAVEADEAAARLLLPGLLGVDGGPARHEAAAGEVAARRHVRAQARRARVAGIEAQRAVEVPERGVVLPCRKGGLGLPDEPLRLCRRLLGAQLIG